MSIQHIAGRRSANSYERESRGIDACAELAEAKTGAQLASSQTRQILVVLFAVAELLNTPSGDLVRVDEMHGQIGVAARGALFQNASRRGRVELEAIVMSGRTGNRVAEEAELLESVERVSREIRAALDFLTRRRRQVVAHRIHVQVVQVVELFVRAELRKLQIREHVFATE